MLAENKGVQFIEFKESQRVFPPSKKTFEHVQAMHASTLQPIHYLAALAFQQARGVRVSLVFNQCLHAFRYFAWKRSQASERRVRVLVEGFTAFFAVIPLPVVSLETPANYCFACLAVSARQGALSVKAYANLFIQGGTHLFSPMNRGVRLPTSAQELLNKRTSF
jgi:hypothetical protein